MNNNNSLPGKNTIIRLLFLSSIILFPFVMVIRENLGDNYSFLVVVWPVAIIIYAISWYIQDRKSEQVNISPEMEKYLIHLTIALSIISVLLIFFLRNMALAVLMITIFIALTTYIKKFYPSSLFLSIALLSVLDCFAISYVTQSFWIWIIGQLSIIVLVVIAASWHQENLGHPYSMTFSIISGFLTMALQNPFDTHPEDFWNIFPGVFLMVELVFLFLISTIVLFLKSPNKDFIPTLKITVSLSLFFLSAYVSYWFLYSSKVIFLN